MRGTRLQEPKRVVQPWYLLNAADCRYEHEPERVAARWVEYINLGFMQGRTSAGMIGYAEHP